MLASRKKSRSLSISASMASPFGSAARARVPAGNPASPQATSASVLHHRVPTILLGGGKAAPDAERHPGPPRDPDARAWNTGAGDPGDSPRGPAPGARDPR